MRLAAELFPCGVCTSSGTVGSSFSYGVADAAMIVAPDTALADAVATACLLYTSLFRKHSQYFQQLVLYCGADTVLVANIFSFLPFNPAHYPLLLHIMLATKGGAV